MTSTDADSETPPVNEGRSRARRHHALTLRRGALLVLGAAILAALLLLVDRPLQAMFARVQPGGDLRRELEHLQQFGSISTLLLVALVMWRLDPLNLRRVLDWALALGIVTGSMLVLKILFGRARPGVDVDPGAFRGPLGSARVGPASDPLHSWQLGAGDVEQLWSMPSSHTAAAFVAAVFLARVYPRLSALVYALAGVVGLGRLITEAHYPSDVVMGGALGYVGARLVIDRLLGMRLIDWIWKRFVNADARPAHARFLADSTGESAGTDQ